MYDHTNIYRGTKHKADTKNPKWRVPFPNLIHPKYESQHHREWHKDIYTIPSPNAIYTLQYQPPLGMYMNCTKSLYLTISLTPSKSLLLSRPSITHPLSVCLIIHTHTYMHTYICGIPELLIISISALVHFTVRITLLVCVR